MSGLLSSVHRKLLDIFGHDAFVWFDRAYVADWAAATVAWVVSWWIKSLPPFQREFSPNDPLINHAHRKDQISGDLNIAVALLVPLITIVAVGTLRASAMDIHHGLLSLYSGSGFTLLVTEFLKNRVGRLRPDFLARCKWEEATETCTGKLRTVMDGRRSFPSGHSSEAFSGMTILSLFLAGVTGAWLFDRPAPSRALFSSRVARLSLTLAPVLYATWVAVSRIEDYRHHKEDVIVGSLLGILISGTCYLIYWPNPFKMQDVTATRTASRPRYVYGENSAGTSSDRYDYELAGIEGHEAEV